MINASFWPFLIKSCVSMRSINDFGPCPSKIGRYIGSAAICPDGVLLTCDQARSTIDTRTIRKSAKARMGTYASGAASVFQAQSRNDLCRYRQSSGCGNSVHDPVTPEVIDERVSRLHLMQRAVRRRCFKQRAQFHETMAGAAGIESVK